MSIQEVDLQDFSQTAGQSEAESTSRQDGGLIKPNLALLRHVNVDLEVRVGRAVLSAAELFSLSAGEVITLQESVDQPLELVLEDQVVARGTLVASGDQLGVRITEVAGTDLPLTQAE